MRYLVKPTDPMTSSSCCRCDINIGVNNVDTGDINVCPEARENPVTNAI